MAAIVCQSRLHRLMLASPKPPPQQPFKSCCFWEESNYAKPHYDDEDNYKADDTPTDWSSIQALSSTVTVSNSIYEVKQSSSLLRLSPKSLELCTEKLGNETGSDDITAETGIDDLLSSSEITREQKSKKVREAARTFPPPLRTIRGSESIRVRPHREDGRLVLQLTKVVPSCFQALRSPGRLRLCFWTNDDIQETQDHVEDNQKEIEKMEQQEQDQSVDDVVENNGRGWEHEQTKGCNSWTVVERPSSSCKEEGDHENNDFLINWGEPRLVTTS
ncbi:hypothetical protein GYH30_029609 [Glycine max]|nr:hypothetical protein JHK87_029570 [Glycine soja]KAH1156875.1 hypothetical protein GYH30_029609 [Glycine max]